jgi:hypothetical protein
MNNITLSEKAEPVEAHEDPKSPYPRDWHNFWMQTWTGVQFRPYAVTPEMINIDDIAHALARVNRFNGHTVQPYSVAQHSVYTSYLVPPQYALEALMHDAVEAYIGDQPSPVKWGQKTFSELEEYIWTEAVVPVFELPDKLADCVKIADLQMLVFELNHVVNDFGYSWGLEHIDKPNLSSVVPDFGMVDGGSYHFGPHGMPLMTPEQAESMFRARFNELRYPLMLSRL